jgi:hypothetical protein
MNIFERKFLVMRSEKPIPRLDHKTPKPDINGKHITALTEEMRGCVQLNDSVRMCRIGGGLLGVCRLDKTYRLHLDRHPRELPGGGSYQLCKDHGGVIVDDGGSAPEAEDFTPLTDMKEYPVPYAEQLNLPCYEATQAGAKKED